MKTISLSISLFSVILNTCYFSQNSLADQITNINLGKSSNFKGFHKDISKPENLISKPNDLEAIKLKSLSYSTKVLKTNYNAIFTNSDFKNTFKDTSSSFTSNYGPVKRSSESTKHCSSKACFE